MMLRVIEFDFWNQNSNKFNLIYIIKKKKTLTVTFNLENNDRSTSFPYLNPTNHGISSPNLNLKIYYSWDRYHLVVS
jgi:hypothetical protein